MINMYFHPSLIFVDTAKSIILGWSLVPLCRLGAGLACRYLTGVEVTSNDKHSSLLQHEVNYVHKTF
jgi:hypothetical protein